MRNLLLLYLVISHLNHLAGQGEGFVNFPIPFFNDEISPTQHWKDNVLSSSNVTCAVMDGGFVWVGTGKGLSRFDGKNFINFSEHPDLSVSKLKSVNSIVKSNAGFFWVCHSRGISKFDPLSFEEQYYNPTEPAGWGKDTVAAFNLIETSRGEIYATTYWGIARYHSERDEFIVQPIDTSHYKNPPHNITTYGILLEDLELGGIWFSSYRYLCFYDYNSKTYFSSLNNPKNWTIFNSAIEHDEVSKFMKDLDGGYWFSVRRRPFLFHFSPKTNAFNQYPLKGEASSIVPQATEMIQINRIEIAFCQQGGGMLIFNTLTNKFRRVFYKLENTYRVPFTPTVNNISVLSNKWVSIATDNGWYLQRCFDFIDDIVPLSKPVKKRSYSQIYEGNNGSLWIRSNNHQLLCYKPDSRVFHTINLHADTSKSDLFYYIYPAQNKNFYTNTSSGIKKIDTHDNSLTQLILKNFNLDSSHKIYGSYKDSLYFISKKNSDSVLIVDNNYHVIGKIPCKNSESNFLYFIFMDTQFRIWASYLSQGGVWVQKTRNETPVSFKTSPQFAHLFRNDSYRRFSEDQNGNVWLCTDEPEVLAFSKKLDTIYFYSQKNGLGNTAFSKVSFLDSSRTILARSQDFLLYNFINSTAIQGDYTFFFNAYPMHSYLLLSNGKAYMASYTDLYIFDFQKMSKKTPPDSPYIAAIISNKKLYSRKEAQVGLVLSQDETEIMSQKVCL